MNNLEMFIVGIPSLVLGWAVIGSPIYNFYKSNQEKKSSGEYE